MDVPGRQLPRWVWVTALIALLLVQACFGLQGINNYWQWGHNGYNGGAYLLGAKNSLRWQNVFPAQYAAGNHEPSKSELYTHAPLMLHLHNIATVSTLGDRELSIRVVPMFYGVMALAVLFGFVKRRWGDLHAIVVGSVYVVLPINQGLANMTNHDTGAITWSLIMLTCYLEWLDVGRQPGRRWLWAAGIFLSCFMAVNWNWPAYYICFVLAIHWLYSCHDKRRQELPRTLGINREHILLAVYSLFVLINFFGHFLLVKLQMGNFEEMTRSFSQRSGSSANIYSRIWNESLEPMFGAPLLGLGALWLIALLVRHSRRQARSADLVPFAFAFAGILHTLLFKKTVIVHIYWPWQLNPFVAMAAGIVLIGAYQQLRGIATQSMQELPAWTRRSASAILAAVVFAPFAWSYFSHTLPLIPEARRVAGTFNHKNYESDHLKIVFGRQLRSWTANDTGVLIMRHIPHRVEFIATIDRIRGWTRRVDRIRPPRLKGATGGWVAIGDVRRTPRAQIIAAAGSHPFKQYGLYFMVDHRVEGQDIEIHNLEPEEPSLWWRFFVNPYDPPMRPVRDREAEARLADEVSRAAAASTRRKKPAPSTPAPRRVKEDKVK